MAPCGPVTLDWTLRLISLRVSNRSVGSVLGGSSVMTIVVFCVPGYQLKLGPGRLVQARDGNQRSFIILTKCNHQRV